MFLFLASLQEQSPDAQWGWPIYLQDWVVVGLNVGKYTIHYVTLSIWEGILFLDFPFEGGVGGW